MKKYYTTLISLLVLISSCETPKKEPSTIPFSKLDSRLQYMSTFLSKDIPKTLNEIDNITDLTKSSYFARVSSAKINNFSDKFNLCLVLYKALKIKPESAELIEIKGNKLTKKFFYKLESENNIYEEVKLMNEINLNRKLINFNVIVTTKDKMVENKHIFPEISIKF